MTRGYLGIDAGTQGLSVVFTDESMQVLATGEAAYEMVPGLEDGCYEQNPSDWEAALAAAMQDVLSQLKQRGGAEMLSVGISGQMHGEVLIDANDQSLGPARLWCDSRNEAEEVELTEALGVKMPKRITAARWLWTTRNRPDLAARVMRITTPGGWLAFRLTGQWNLGIGDASGMFPIDQSTLDYDQALAAKFDAIVGKDELPTITEMLPKVQVAGEDAGCVSEAASEWLGLKAGISVAPAEGDQPASLAGALIGAAGSVSVSFGTSVCANAVGDKAFEGVSHAVDHFCAPDGKPINMVWLRNGTTYMNSVVEMFGSASGLERGEAFQKVMPEVLGRPADCDGMMALPFMDDEPGLSVSRGGSAMLVGINATNNNAGNAVKAAVLSTMYNLRLGCEVLDRQGFERTNLVLSGGLTKTPELGQVLADVFNAPVSLPASAEEGCAWGAAILAKFRFEKAGDSSLDWSEFLAKHVSDGDLVFEPCAKESAAYEVQLEKYRRLVKTHVAIEDALNG